MSKRKIYVGFVEPPEKRLKEDLELNEKDAIYVQVFQVDCNIGVKAKSSVDFKYFYRDAEFNAKETFENFPYLNSDVNSFIDTLVKLNDGIVDYRPLFNQGARAYKKLRQLETLARDTIVEF